MTIASVLMSLRLNHTGNMANFANGNNLRTKNIIIEQEAHMGEGTDIEQP